MHGPLVATIVRPFILFAVESTMDISLNYFTSHFTLLSYISTCLRSIETPDFLTLSSRGELLVSIEGLPNE